MKKENSSVDHGERRSSAHFNSATNLSERVPSLTNTIRINTSLFDRVTGQRFEHTTWAARRHRWFWARIGGGDFTKNKVGDFGRRASKHLRRCFSQDDLKKMKGLKTAHATTYLLVKGLNSTEKYWRFPFPRDEEFPEEQKHRDMDFVSSLGAGKRRDNPSQYAVSARRELEKKRKRMDDLFYEVDYSVAGIACMMGCEIRPRFESDDSALAKNFLTDPSEQQSSDLDNLDVPLRFHQSAVERKLPDPNAVQSTEPPACAFRLYYCVKNLWRMPIYLIRVSELISDHLCPYEPEEKKAKILSILQTQNKFNRRPPQPSDGYSDSQKSDRVIFNRGTVKKPDWIMLYDHERVQAVDKEGEEALYELRNAIRRARRDAIRIDLEPTDILILDNLRALISRREYFPTRRMDVLRIWIGLPTSKSIERFKSGIILTRMTWNWFRPHRWLRTYHLFRDDSMEKELPSALRSVSSVISLAIVQRLSYLTHTLRLHTKEPLQPRLGPQ